MNRTNHEHGVIALVIQLALGWWIGWEVAGAVVVAIFFGREYGQAEYKCRARTGLTLTQLMPWHVLKREYWTKDGIFDFITPIGYVSLIPVGLLLF